VLALRLCETCAANDEDITMVEFVSVVMVPASEDDIINDAELLASISP